MSSSLAPDDPLLSLADALGRHALGVWALLLLVGLAAAALGVRLLDRRDAPGVASAPQLSRLLPALATGFGLLLAAAAVFAELAEALRDQGSPLGAFDDRLALALDAHVEPAALAVFGLLTHLGDVWTLTGLGVLVTLVLLLRGRTGLAVFWAVSLAGNGILIRALKSVFERVRPQHDTPLTHSDGWSFPSGHTAGAVVAYGLLAYLAWRLLPRRWRLPCVLAATATAITVGVSRVFLRVHHASDVLAGWAGGGAWLIVSIACAEMARRWVRGRRAPISKDTMR